VTKIILLVLILLVSSSSFALSRDDKGEIIKIGYGCSTGTEKAWFGESEGYKCFSRALRKLIETNDIETAIQEGCNSFSGSAKAVCEKTAVHALD